jgi:accessory colonization factor AcfC
LIGTQKIIAKSNITHYENLMIFMGLLEATVLNVAEQNERLTKLIQINNSSNPQTTLKELLKKANNHQKELTEIKNDPNKKWFDEFVKHASKTADE